MTLERYRNQNPRSRSEVADEIEATLQSLAPAGESYPVIQGTQHYALIQSFGQTIAVQQEQAIQSVYESSFLTDATGEELTKKAREIGVIRQDATAATGVVTFSRDSTAGTDYTIPAGTVVGTRGDGRVTFETTETATITSGTKETTVNVQCTETGPEGNVGQGTITVLVSGTVSGVDSVNNPQPTGDPTYTLTDGQTLQTIGENKESDPELRSRALDSVAVGGAGTAEATELALNNIPEVESADVLANRSDDVVQGVDPWKTEIRIYGGDIAVIADRLYEVLPLTTLMSLQGGVNGTKESVTIDDSELYGSLEIPITRPTERNLDLTVRVLYNPSYSGDSDVKDAIVSYIGGTLVDNSGISGLTQGEDVLVNKIENAAESVVGVEYASVELLDADGDGTDDTTTNADGVQLYEVSDTEIPLVDADDVTINASAYK